MTDGKARYDLVITGKRVIDPASGLDGPAELAIRDGRIAALAPALPPHTAARTLDAGDRVLVVSRDAVIALDVRTGNQVWRHAGDWTRSVVTDDRLVAINDESMVTSVSLGDGTLTRPVNRTVGAVATLAVNGDTLYAARRDGTLLSVDLSAARGRG